MSAKGSVTSPAARWRRRGLMGALVLGTVLALGLGCGLREPRLGRDGEFTGNFRRTEAEISRLIRNAHYFKLMGQPELALKELEEVHRQDPGNLKITNALAQYCDELGLHERAQQIYREGLALDPDNPVLQNNLGFSYYLAGNYRQAEACYRKTLARQVNYAAARNNLGLLLCRQGRQDEAMRLWQAAEGEAATQKMTEVLAALGLGDESRYAQEIRPHPEAQAMGRQPSADRQPGTQPVTALASPPPAQAPAAARRAKVEPATGAAAPAAATGAVKPARTLTPAPVSPTPEIAALKARENRVTAPPLALVRQPDSKESAGPTFREKPTASRLPITAQELVGTNIAVLNGNGSPYLAHDTRSRLSQQGFNVVSIANYRDFGVDRTVIYYRPDAKQVATLLNHKFFPKAEIAPAPQLAGSIAVKVILGRDLLPQQHAEARQTLEPKRL